MQLLKRCQNTVIRRGFLECGDASPRQDHAAFKAVPRHRNPNGAMECEDTSPRRDHVALKAVPRTPHQTGFSPVWGRNPQNYPLLSTGPLDLGGSGLGVRGHVPAFKRAKALQPRWFLECTDGWSPRRVRLASKTVPWDRNPKKGGHVPKMVDDFRVFGVIALDKIEQMFYTWIVSKSGACVRRQGGSLMTQAVHPPDAPRRRQDRP